MQQSKAPHISEQEAKDRLEQQAGLSFEYAHAYYNKNLKQWSFAVKNKAGAVVFSAVSFKDFAPYRALARHLNTSFEEVLDRYVFVYGAQHECGQGQDDERYCLIDKGWLKIADIEEAFIKKFGQYRKDYEMHDELWVLTIDGSECSSSTYKKHPKPGWPPKAERAVLVLGKLESQALQLSFDAFLTPTEQPLSTSDKEPSTEQPQTAPHSQKPAQPAQTAVSDTDTGKPKKPAKPDGSGTDTGKPKKQNEHKGGAKPEHGKSRTKAAPPESDESCAGTPKVEAEVPKDITVGEQGDADDLYNTARNYQYGSGGLKKDESTALGLPGVEDLFFEAADAGNADATKIINQYDNKGRAPLLAICLQEIREFLSACKELINDHPPRLVLLAVMIYLIMGLWISSIIRDRNKAFNYHNNGDKATALVWFRKAAAKGDAGAMNMMGLYYSLGLGGLKEDEAAALEWFRKAADAGDAGAMYMIGQYYDEGWGGLKKDEVTALEWYRKAADAGSVSALYNIAGYYEDGSGGLKKDKAIALEWYRKAADAGDAGAMNMIGQYYAEGLGGLKKDDKTALEWYRKAADKGHADAMNMIGRYYDEGWGGLEEDKAAALEWYRKAADAGSVFALYYIATYYEDGSGGLKADKATALEWYRKAADAISEIITEYDKQGEASATTLECVPKTANQNDANTAGIVKELETHTTTDKSTTIGNHKKVTVYFKKIFRFDRYVVINIIIYMIAYGCWVPSIFFDSDTRKKLSFILSTVSMTASGLSILYSTLVFCAMYI